MLTFGVIKCQVAKAGGNLEPELAKLRKMGVPTELRDLAIVPPVADSDNAALLYAQIEELTPKIQESLSYQDTQVIESYNGFPRDRAICEAALDKHRPVLELIDQLSTRKRVDFKQGDSGILALRSTPTVIRRLLDCRIAYWIERRNFDQALRDLETQYVIANHQSHALTMSQVRQCFSNNATAHASLDRFLYAVQGNQPMLAKAEAMLLRRQQVPSIRKVLAGEVVNGRIRIQSLRTWSKVDYRFSHTEPGALQKGVDRLTLHDPSFRRMFEASAVATWREIFEKVPKDESDLVGFNKVLRDADSKIRHDNSFQNKVNQLTFPRLDETSHDFATVDTNHRLALLVVKLLRMPPNQRPTDLSSFGKLAIDPMDGKPMRYLRQGNGFKVWSVGKDLIDNGGTIMRPRSSHIGTDIVMGYQVNLPTPPITPVFVYAPSPIRGGSRIPRPKPLAAPAKAP